MRLNLNFDYSDAEFDVFVRTSGKYSKVSIETKNKRAKNYDVKKQQRNKKNKYWQTAKA